MTESTETPLYNGRVIARHHPVGHMHFLSIDGGPFKRKKGVTTYINIKDKSRPLGIWQQGITADFLLSAIEQGKKIDIDLALEAVIQNDVQKQAAADIGTEIHGWCERSIKHDLKISGYEDMPDIPDFPEAVTGVNAFEEWKKKNKIQFISSERVIYSLEHDYMGIMDLEAVINGKYCNANDFKSSNGLYNSVLAQTAAYEHADREERKCKKTESRWAIRFSKYDEKEYMRREERKREIKKAIARIKGKEYRDYGIPEYKVFEARQLDSSPKDLARDFQAFLYMKGLFDWDAETDFSWADRKLNK